MMTMVLPMIPAGLLHDMIAITTTTENDYLSGGQYYPTSETQTLFKGAVLPLSNEDLQYDAAGTYTRNNQKIYTNGFVLGVNQRVIDTFDNQAYTVETELTHGPIHPMKRYIVTCVGVADER